MLQALTAFRRSVFRTGRRTRRAKTASSHRLALESLESRQLLSATPLELYVVDDATANVSYSYSASGSAQGSTSLASANAAPRGVTSTIGLDQTWTIDANRKVHVYDAGGVLLGSWTAGTLAANATPEGIATDGNDIWIVDSKSDKVFRYAGAASRLSGSQNAAGSFALASGNSAPKDVVTDGASLWVVDDAKQTDKVFKYSTAGSLVGSWTIDAANKAPTGIALDPANIGDIWIADSGADRVYKYTAAAARNDGSQNAATSFALASANKNPQGIAVAGRADAEAPYEVEWVRQFGGARDEIGLGVATDGSGNVYLSGRTMSELAAPNPLGQEVPAIASFDSDGNANWIQQQDPLSTGNHSGVRVAADGLGNVFQITNELNNYDAAGNLQWSVAIPGAGDRYDVTTDGLGFAYTAAYGASDIVVTKFDGPTGNVVWSQTLNVGSGAGSFGINADGLGNIYVSGRTTGSVIGPNAGGTDGVVAKFTDAGALLWARQFGSSGDEQVWDVAADASGNVYTVGQTSGNLAATNLGNLDLFVTKHDAAGNLLWTRQLGTTGEETLNGAWADAVGNVYAAGWTRGALAGPSLGGGADAVVVKYSTTGDLSWTKQLGSVDRDATNDIFGDNLGNIYLAGNTRGSWAAPNAGGADFVIVKLAPPAMSLAVSTLAASESTALQFSASGLAADSPLDNSADAFTDESSALKKMPTVPAKEQAFAALAVAAQSSRVTTTSPVVSTLANDAHEKRDFDTALAIDLALESALAVRL